MGYMGQGPQGMGGTQVTVYGPGTPLPPGIAAQVQFANYLVQVANQFHAMTPTLQPLPPDYPARGLADYGIRPAPPQANWYVMPASYQPASYNANAGSAFNYGPPPPYQSPQQFVRSPQASPQSQYIPPKMVSSHPVPQAELPAKQFDLQQVAGEQKYPEATSFVEKQVDDNYGSGSGSVKLEQSPSRAKKIALWFKGLFSRKKPDQTGSTQAGARTNLVEKEKGQESASVLSRTISQSPSSAPGKTDTSLKSAQGIKPEAQVDIQKKKKAPPRPPPPSPSSVRNAVKSSSKTETGNKEPVSEPVYSTINKQRSGAGSDGRVRRAPPPPPPPYQPKENKVTQQEQPGVKQTRTPGSESVRGQNHPKSLDSILDNDYEVISFDDEIENSEPLAQPSEKFAKKLSKGQKNATRFGNQCQAFKLSMEEYTNKGVDVARKFKARENTVKAKNIAIANGSAAFGEYVLQLEKLKRASDDISKQLKEIKKFNQGVEKELLQEGNVALPQWYSEMKDQVQKFEMLQAALVEHISATKLARASASQRVSLDLGAVKSWLDSNRLLKSAVELASGE